MIIELYVMIQVLAFIVFLISWFRKNVLLWALSIILFGIQTFLSFNIQYLITIVSNSTSFVTETIVVSSLPMASINMLFGSLGLIMFFWEIFNPDSENIQIL
jgi:hypothetical protein